MKIRRYMAKDAQEAILKVKMDLGNEALILNTRKVKQKGLLGLFAKPMVEVLAAVDEAQEKSGSTAKQYTSKADTGKSAEKIDVLEHKVSDMEESLRKISDQLQRNMPTTVLKIGDIFYNNLIKNDVDPEIARAVLDQADSISGAGTGVNDSVMRLQNVLTTLLGKVEPVQSRTAGRPRVIIFIGPTGVGKTTTLAKIAANCLLNEKKTVGLITADTYRIAAVEQLKTYAEILGIPVSVAYSAQDMKESVSRYGDKDIILIDTAGRSHRNKTQFEELQALIAASEADEIYLVLSATTGIKNCREILNSYSFLQEYKLIFTKLDEAPVYGIILNVRYLTGKSLSYITTGQGVPDDIEIANIEKIARNLIGSVV